MLGATVLCSVVLSLQGRRPPSLSARLSSRVHRSACQCLSGRQTHVLDLPSRICANAPATLAALGPSRLFRPTRLVAAAKLGSRSCSPCHCHCHCRSHPTHPVHFHPPKDADKSGCLSKEEVLDGLQACVDLDWRRIESSIDSLWTTWDRDSGGSLSYEEFSHPTTGLLNFVRRNFARAEGGEPREPPDIRRRAREWFGFWDEDGSGALSKSEIVRALVKTFRVHSSAQAVQVATIEETVDAVFPLFDSDGSGEVDVDEFTMADGLCDTIIASMRL